MLYSYQASLPRLPLPSLDGTISRYLLSIRPLSDDDKYERMVRLAHEFRDGIGRKFQRYLWLKSWWASNYVSDWWEEFVYLRGRQPLMVNSNFYGIDALVEGPTTKQTARAANLIYSSLLFRKQIDRQELKPVFIIKFEIIAFHIQSNYLFFFFITSYYITFALNHQLMS